MSKVFILSRKERSPGVYGGIIWNSWSIRFHATTMQPAYSTLKTNSGIRTSSMIGGDGFTALRCVKGQVAALAGAGTVGSHNSEMISMVCS